MQHEKQNIQAMNDGHDAEEICWLLRHGQKRTPRQYHFVCDYSLPNQTSGGEPAAPKPGRQFGAGEPSHKQMGGHSASRDASNSFSHQFF